MKHPSDIILTRILEAINEKLKQLEKRVEKIETELQDLQEERLKKAGLTKF